MKDNVRMLAVASGGGHWEQLMAMRLAFEGADVCYATTLEGLPQKFALKEYAIIPDCNRDEPVKFLVCIYKLTLLMLRIRPNVVISTGALPGLVAMMLGRFLRARTIWIDSLANVNEMSMSGRYAKRFATVWITQWPEVANATGAQYIGRVL